MFRKMRRCKQQLLLKETIAVMNRCTNGILACVGDENYPYAVPLSYVYLKDRIYFHSAKKGHKIDAIIKNPKVSFCVIDKDSIVSEEYTTYFRSVIAFGKARITEDPEMTEAFKALVQKYSGSQPEVARHKEVMECTKANIIAIDIEHITGKEAIELVKGKNF